MIWSLLYKTHLGVKFCPDQVKKRRQSGKGLSQNTPFIPFREFQKIDIPDYQLFRYYNNFLASEW